MHNDTRKILIVFFLNKGKGLPSTQLLVCFSSSALQVTARPSGFSLKSRSHIHNASFKSRWKWKKKKVYSVSDKGFSAQLLMCHPSAKNWTGSGRNWPSGRIGELSCSLITVTGFEFNFPFLSIAQNKRQLINHINEHSPQAQASKKLGQIEKKLG